MPQAARRKRVDLNDSLGCNKSSKIKLDETVQEHDKKGSCSERTQTHRPFGRQAHLAAVHYKSASEEQPVSAKALAEHDLPRAQENHAKPRKRRTPEADK